MPTTHVFGFDPGEVNNGFVWIKYDSETKIGDTKIKQICTPDALHSLLWTVWDVTQRETTKPDIYFVVENFRVSSESEARKKTFFYDEVKTVRVIGGIELAAKWCGARVIMQEPANVLPGARRWAKPVWGKAMDKKHLDDDISAWCHAVHFMRNRGMINTADQITLFGQERM